jgi:hypothetical protein
MLSLNYHAPISNDQIEKVPSFTEHYLLNMYISYFYSTNIFLHKTDTPTDSDNWKLSRTWQEQGYSALGAQ